MTKKIDAVTRIFPTDTEPGKTIISYTDGSEETISNVIALSLTRK